MQKKQKPCIFFQKGNCRNGSNCEFSHELDGGGMNQERMVINSTDDNPGSNPGNNPGSNFPPNLSKKICGFFLKGTCTKQNCKFFHGYAENLQNVMIEKIHEKNIIGMCPISDKKFLTADQNLIQIWLITDTEHKIMGTQPFEEKITKVIYSSEKVIVATQIEQMYE